MPAGKKRKLGHSLNTACGHIIFDGQCGLCKWWRFDDHANVWLAQRLREPASRARLSGYELAANFAALIGGAMHVDVHAAGFIGFVFLVCEFGTCRNRPNVVRRLREADGDGPIP